MDRRASLLTWSASVDDRLFCSTTSTNTQLQRASELSYSGFCWLMRGCCQWLTSYGSWMHITASRMPRVVVSVSTSWSWDSLETYQRLVSVLSRRKLSTSRSRLSWWGQRLGLGHWRLVPIPVHAASLALNSMSTLHQCVMIHCIGYSSLSTLNIRLWWMIFSRVYVSAPA